MATFDRGHALVIGVGAYDDPRWEVPTAARDAQGLFDTLIDPDLAGYGRAQAELLLDDQATKLGVLEALRRLANRCGPDSVALISFTGHGALGDDGLYYLGTRSARFAGERIVGGTGLQVAELARALRDIPAGRLLLVVNACSSGHLADKFRGAAIAPDEAPPAAGQMLPDGAADEILASGEGRAVLAASRADQLSYFLPDERHSFFGQALIDGIRGGAASAARGYVGLYELYESVYRQVRDVTLRRLGEAQEPVLTLVQQAGPFPVARYPRATSDSAAISQRPPADLPVRVVERDVIAAIGQGATAIKAEPGSTVNVDNRRVGIDLGGLQAQGNITFGDIAGGHIIKDVDVTIQPGGAGGAANSLQALGDLRERLATARDVDEDARDDAANKLNQAHRALSQGDRARARQRVDEALVILSAMDNGYIRSLARKIAALRDAI
jgi:hypothetical protein